MAFATQINSIKGIVPTKIIIIYHYHVCLCILSKLLKSVWELFGNQLSSKYLILCYAEEIKLYRFVNDDTMYFHEGIQMIEFKLWGKVTASSQSLCIDTVHTKMCSALVVLNTPRMFYTPYDVTKTQIQW